MEMVYIAGPYMGDNKNRLSVEQNVLDCKKQLARMLDFGMLPISPITMYDKFDLYTDYDEEFWYELTMELLKKCDSVWFYPGYERSRGAKNELRYAVEHGMTIYFEGIVANDNKDVLDILYGE